MTYEGLNIEVTFDEDLMKRKIQKLSIGIIIIICVILAIIVPDAMARFLKNIIHQTLTFDYLCPLVTLVIAAGVGKPESGVLRLILMSK